MRSNRVLTASRRIIRVLTLVLILLPLVPGAARPVGAQEATPGESLSPAHGRFSGQVDIGGRSLWLECMGGREKPRVQVVTVGPLM